jgi:uncharacterized membrane protein
MRQVHESIMVNASNDIVADILVSPEYVRQWFEGLDTLEVSSDHPNPGAVHTWTYKVMGVEFKGKNTVLEYIPGVKMKLQMDGLIVGMQEVRQSGEDGNVMVELSFDYEMSGGVLGKLAEPIVHQMNVSNIKKSLEKIKKLAESG